jgi:ubiquinone biosynthesis UbiH/UbiF/VisC/COQ6 family hydroxylase
VDFDLIVVGGGPVGVAVARAALGCSVALVAQERREIGRPRADAFDARIYALSPGNVAFLREIRAWQGLPLERLTPIHAMRVFGDRPGAEIEFDAYRAGVPELAWTVEDGALQDAMWAAAQGREDIELFAPAACESLDAGPQKVCLTLRDGRTLSGALMVGADGANSFVRKKAGIAVVDRGYGQSAVVANFECEKSHSNMAFQWFQGGPVLALLPLPGRRTSMVWSLPSAQAESVAALDPDALCRAVSAASRHQLGALSLISAVRSYPLRRLSAARLVAPRVALAGDAAHVIHPLAGQGLNLGLQDARALAAAVTARGPVRDAGDFGLLRRYERARAEPILSMDFMVDGLLRLFGSRNNALSRLRNAGLNLTGQLPVLKNLLMRRAMS